MDGELTILFPPRLLDSFGLPGYCNAVSGDLLSILHHKGQLVNISGAL